MGRRSDKYEGAKLWMVLNVYRRSLNSIHCLTGSQWRCYGAGVMYWYEGVLVIMQAAVF